MLESMLTGVSTLVKKKKSLIGQAQAEGGDMVQNPDIAAKVKDSTDIQDEVAKKRKSLLSLFMNNNSVIKQGLL